MKRIYLLSIIPITIILISACSLLGAGNDSKNDQDQIVTATLTPLMTLAPTKTTSPIPTNTTIPTDTPTLTKSPEPSMPPTVENTPIIDSRTICYGGGDEVIYLVTGKRTEEIYVSWIDRELTFWQELRRVPFCQRFTGFTSGATLFLEAKYQDLRDDSEIKCQIFYQGELIAEDSAIASDNQKVTCSAPLE